MPTPQPLVEWLETNKQHMELAEQSSSSTRARTEQPETPAIAMEEALGLADRTGWHHRRVCCTCLLSVACGGMGGAAAPFILGPVAREGLLGPAATGLLGSAMFIGMWVGSFVGGAVSDALGPGRTMAMAVAGLAFCGAAPALLPATAAFAVLGRVAVGFSLVCQSSAHCDRVAHTTVVFRAARHVDPPCCCLKLLGAPLR